MKKLLPFALCIVCALAFCGCHTNENEFKIKTPHGINFNSDEDGGSDFREPDKGRKPPYPKPIPVPSPLPVQPR